MSENYSKIGALTISPTQHNKQKLRDSIDFSELTDVTNVIKFNEFNRERTNMTNVIGFKKIRQESYDLDIDT